MDHSWRLLPPTRFWNVLEQKAAFQMASLPTPPALPGARPDPTPTAASKEARDSVQLLQTMTKCFHGMDPSTGETSACTAQAIVFPGFSQPAPSFP